MVRLIAEEKLQTVFTPQSDEKYSAVNLSRDPKY